MRYSNQVVEINYNGFPLEVELDFYDGEPSLNDIRSSITGDCVLGDFTDGAQNLIKHAASESIRAAEVAREAA